MPRFEFQILLPDGIVIGGDHRDLPGMGELWGHLEVIAIGLRRHRDLLLRVMDEEGGIVVMSGVASVVDSIKQCRKAGCPIKGLLTDGRVETGACAPCMTIAALDIPGLDVNDTLSRAPRD